VQIRGLEDRDREWLRARLEEAWGLPVVSPSGAYDAPERLDGLVAEDAGEPVGAVTWACTDDAWEVVTLETTRRRAGIGSALMDGVRRHAVAAGASKVWLITTDDNPGAVAFYDAIGMRRVRDLPRFSAHVARYKASSGPDYDALEYEWRLDGAPAR
jgi:ribosomal protein S18 acetylase RimI-like enzyme